MRIGGIGVTLCATANVLAISQMTENGLLTLVGTRPTALAKRGRRRNSQRSAPAPTTPVTLFRTRFDGRPCPFERIRRLARQHAPSR